MTANDLQPKTQTIKVKDVEYKCQPIRMSHRLIIAKIQPLFVELGHVVNGEKVNLTGAEMLELEAEIDTLIQSLIPELRNVTLDIEEIGNILQQVMDYMLPSDSKELKDAKVEVNTDLKAETTI